MSLWGKVENFAKTATGLNMIGATTAPFIQGGLAAKQAGQAGGTAADPFSGYRSGSAGALEALMGGDLSSITGSPAYKAEMDLSKQAIDRKAAAAGMFGSGNMLSQLTESAAGIATKNFDQEWGLLSLMSGNAQYSPETMAKLYDAKQQQSQGAVGGLMNLAGLGSFSGLSGFL